jgi:hypothetical protein
MFDNKGQSIKKSEALIAFYLVAARCDIDTAEEAWAQQNQRMQVASAVAKHVIEQSKDLNLLVPL